MPRGRGRVAAAAAAVMWMSCRRRGGGGARELLCAEGAPPLPTLRSPPLSPASRSSAPLLRLQAGSCDGSPPQAKRKPADVCRSSARAGSALFAPSHCLTGGCAACLLDSRCACLPSGCGTASPSCRFDATPTSAPPPARRVVRRRALDASPQQRESVMRRPGGKWRARTYGPVSGPERLQRERADGRPFSARVPQPGRERRELAEHELAEVSVVALREPPQVRTLGARASRRRGGYVAARPRRTCPSHCRSSSTTAATTIKRARLSAGSWEFRGAARRPGTRVESAACAAAEWRSSKRRERDRRSVPTARPRTGAPPLFAGVRAKSERALETARDPTSFPSHCPPLLHPVGVPDPPRPLREPGPAAAGRQLEVDARAHAGRDSLVLLQNLSGRTNSFLNLSSHTTRAHE